MKSRQQLIETLNKVPRPESVIQNQYLLMEILLDIRDAVLNQNERTIAPWEEEDDYQKSIQKQKTLKLIDKNKPI